MANGAPLDLVAMAIKPLKLMAREHGLGQEEEDGFEGRDPYIAFIQRKVPAAPPKLLAEGAAAEGIAPETSDTAPQAPDSPRRLRLGFYWHFIFLLFTTGVLPVKIPKPQGVVQEMYLVRPTWAHESSLWPSYGICTVWLEPCGTYALAHGSRMLSKFFGPAVSVKTQ